MTEQEMFREAMKLAYELGKNRSKELTITKVIEDEYRDSTYFKNPSPETIRKIRKFARDYKPAAPSDHDVEHLRDHVTELQENAKKTADELNMTRASLENKEKIVISQSLELQNLQHQISELEKDKKSLLDQLGKAKEKAILADAKAKQAELDNEEIALINKCRSIRKGITIITHYADGWLGNTLTEGELVAKLDLNIQELTNRIK